MKHLILIITVFTQILFASELEINSLMQIQIGREVLFKEQVFIPSGSSSILLDRSTFSRCYLKLAEANYDRVVNSGQSFLITDVYHSNGQNHRSYSRKSDAWGKLEINLRSDDGLKIWCREFKLYTNTVLTRYLNDYFAIIPARTINDVQTVQ